MPPIPSLVNSYTTSLSFVDYRGQKRSIVIKRSVSTEAAMTNVGLLASAIANASNAVVFRRVDSSTGEANISSLTAYDEAESSVNTVGVLAFRTPSGRLEYVEIPAVDASLIDQSGDALEVDTATPNLIGQIVNSYLVMNPTHVYERSFIATRKGTKARQVARPGVAEPATGQLPPPEPGL